MPRKNAMRELTGHKVNGCNEALKVEALDEPGVGGASHYYRITGWTIDANRHLTGTGKDEAGCAFINFQNGPIREAGVNGLTHEALLAILIDRLEGFQSGPYECAENQDALDHLRKAQEVLKDRTIKRLARGVEGTHTV